MRARPKQIVIRASEKEIEKIKNKVEKSKLTQNEYLVRSALNKKIVVVDGLIDASIQLKKIGTNLNQITKKVNQGEIPYSEELAEIQKEVKNIWQSLRQLSREQV